MINKYSTVPISTGQYTAGLYKVLIAPREWLIDDVKIDFNTGNVLTALALEIPRAFLELEFTPDTYEYTEKPKSTKNGAFFDTTLKGSINNITEDILLTLHTFVNHEMVAILHDKKKRRKVVGNKSNAMVFSFSTKEVNDQGGLLVCEIDMGMNAEKAAPFYVL